MLGVPSDASLSSNQNTPVEATKRYNFQIYLGKLWFAVIEWMVDGWPAHIASSKHIFILLVERIPAPVEVGSLSQFLGSFMYTSHVVVSDFYPQQVVTWNATKTSCSQDSATLISKGTNEPWIPNVMASKLWCLATVAPLFFGWKKTRLFLTQKKTMVTKKSCGTTVFGYDFIQFTNNVCTRAGRFPRTKSLLVRRPFIFASWALRPLPFPPGAIYMPTLSHTNMDFWSICTSQVHMKWDMW